MSYYVNLGGVNLHLIESVKTDADRDITDYDGLGSGKFDVPENAGLKEFTISCELRQKVDPKYKSWSASELFKQFDVWRAQKDPIRLIVTSSQYPAENISILVIFKSYSKNEKFPGINETEIHLKEHKNVGVKTTGVPYITRPGKIPIPKTVTITKRNTAYSAAKKITGATPKAGEKGFIGPMQTVVFKNIKNSKPVDNPCTMPTTVSVGVITAPLSSMPVDQSKIVDTSYTGKNFYDGLVESAASTFKSIGKGIEGWLKGG